MTTHCPTCEAPANPANFGAMCDPCASNHRERQQRTRHLLRAFGQTKTPLGRAIGA